MINLINKHTYIRKSDRSSILFSICRDDKMKGELRVNIISNQCIIYYYRIQYTINVYYFNLLKLHFRKFYFSYLIHMFKLPKKFSNIPIYYHGNTEFSSSFFKSIPGKKG